MTGVFPLLPLGALFAIAVQRSGGRIARWRLLCLAAGLLVCFVALGPLDPAADRRLAVHMVQHLLLGVLAPVLVALGTPVRLAFAALGRRGRRTLATLLHAPVLRAVLRPAVAVTLAAAVAVLAHLPGVLEGVHRDPLLHAAEHAALFWSALAAWIAVLGADPVPSVLGPVGVMAAVAAWSLPMAAIGAVYANADRVLAGAGARDLADVHGAGTLMLLAGPVLMAPVALAAGGRALWRQEDRQRRRERAEVAP